MLKASIFTPRTFNLSNSTIIAFLLFSEFEIESLINLNFLLDSCS